ncbi:hypothetical protein KY308_00530 [Candidatus Woesearchaeota archaeon]|nr:hypothetical protein [Candidatus Woesearchaeota archaeon]
MVFVRPMSRIAEELKLGLGQDIISILERNGALIRQISDRALVISEQEINENPLLIVWENNYGIRYLHLAEPETAIGDFVKMNTSDLTHTYESAVPAKDLARKLKAAGINLSDYI